MTTALRATAVLIAAAGVIDPPLTVRRSVPVPIEIRLPAPGDPDFDRAANVRRDLLARLGSLVTVNAGEDPHTIVAIGNASARTAGRHSGNCDFAASPFSFRSGPLRNSSNRN